MQDAPERMNDMATCSETRTKSVPSGSLKVLAQHVMRARFSVPVAKHYLITTLLEQLDKYESKPDVIGPKILKTIERI